jgi:hypothetical protein
MMSRKPPGATGGVAWMTVNTRVPMEMAPVRAVVVVLGCTV